MNRIHTQTIRLGTISLLCTLALGFETAFGADSSPLERWKACVHSIHSRDESSGAELRALLERPQTVQQLLQNLKLAGERRLLLQASLYEEATLLRIFNGSAVIWHAPDPFYSNLKAGLLDVTVLSNSLPGFAIELKSTCVVLDYRDPTGSVSHKVDANGFLNIRIQAPAQVLLSDVRDVFGAETRQFTDPGMDPHGNTYTPDEKGAVVYESTRSEGNASSSIETAFHLKPVTAQPPQADVVARISMHETQHITQGSP